MRVFVAGATGAVGRRLVPALVAAGHEVVGTTRHPARAGELRAAGARPSVLDPMNREAVREAVAAARPAVVIHELTSLSRVRSLRRLDREFAATNALRTQGLDHLLDAAIAAGARRFLAQSFTGWTNQRAGGPVKTEDDPLDPLPIATSRETLAAIRYLETAVISTGEIDGLALRYGLLYGPGTGVERGGPIAEWVRRRWFPVVGGGAGVWSLVHIDDAVGATVAAVDRGDPGVYNITDDDPARANEWIPYLAAVLGAKPPRRIPAWLARPIVGAHGVAMMTASRGSSNTKAKEKLGWRLTYPSWREGFRAEFG